MTHDDNTTSRTGAEERWVSSLRTLAEKRGDAPGLVKRAAALSRSLKISPWIALAVVEGLVNLKEAAILDGAAKCPTLRDAVLDRRALIADLKCALPYAAYFLARDLLSISGSPVKRMSDALLVAQGLLENEKTFREDGTLAPVRLFPTAEYMVALRRIFTLKQRERFDLETAMEIELGQLSLDLARRKQDVDREEKMRRLNPRRFEDERWDQRQPSSPDPHRREHSDRYDRRTERPFSQGAGERRGRTAKRH